MVRDTRYDLRDRLRRDLALPQGELADAVIEAAVFCTEQGYGEMAPVQEAYPDLLCPWDGRLHRSEECDRKVREYQAAVMEGSV
jgi:hypothetical protein